MTDSIFTKIVKGEVPARVVYEDAGHLAFLNIKPDRAGHLLVVPKQQVDKFYEMADGDLAGLIVVAKKIATALERASGGLRTKVEIVGIDVPHVHVHLLPLVGQGGKDADNKLYGKTPDEIQAAIVEELKK
jgi:histidine triad (HIT) family protein